MEQIIGNIIFWDEAMTKLRRGEGVAEIVDTIIWELYSIRRHSSPEVWKNFATTTCRQHPIMSLLHQDPLTRRAFSKPRGYAGDAQVLDFLYAVEDGVVFPAVENISELGRQIHHYLVHTETASAVRFRKRIIAEKLNELAASEPKPHVLSLACGHLREAKCCSALLEGRLGRFVAVDEDKESLAVIEQELGPLGVKQVQASVRDLLKGEISFAGLDLIYTAGLYDYLVLPVAQSLSRLLFQMLNPGGRLLLANFVPGIRTAGYMEAYLDWWLIYRTEAELHQLAEALPGEQVESISTFIEENKNIAFLEVERRGSMW